MNVAVLESLTRRPPVILTSLLVLAVLAFAGVNRLVNRFHEQEKAVARHLYERGVQAQKEGKPEVALGDFRAALGYSHDNSQYRLSLARALRDSGRTAEAETYLVSLWESMPQEGPVNLALGRLFAREQLFDKTVQYYHNAMYGYWANEPEARRRETQLELIEFLLQHKAHPQAQAELISLSSAMPSDPNQRLRVAGLFQRAQDDLHALTLYQQVLQADPGNRDALFGAGQSAFSLGWYRTADGYLRAAVEADANNEKAVQLRKMTSLVLQSDPFAPRITDAERMRRVRAVFQRAGDRLDGCALSEGIDLTPRTPSNGLPSLKEQWLELKPKLARMPSSGDGILDRLTDLVFEIERETQAVCGPPEGLDQALVLISQDRAGVER
jgi:tetratricopeptide (TPR) repeat protein